ncbi:peptide/nickel transport system permease protein [Desulfacinum hydrothermale DSM 13146]|uniref:Peptide/nickel transport system permease protein n=1 Tax=Desulfacinum hydrothermale DSM 13146 TaxID=1121390 RepID=A0A1W1XG94_9BACT|nr:ABC transporter permease [Desulfacinum hydrothermale]SMC22531.1 peptide/nickel transport system permease protein [Desulfacinum hydrothermale DSM 13146]
MREYIVRRLLYTLMTLFAVATILFFLFRMLPGDPTAQVISPALDEVAQARLKQAFGLDQPLHIQYLLYLKNLFALDWGRSFTSSRKVFDIIQYRFWNTIFLMGAGMCLTLMVGIGMGMVMAWRRNGPLDLWPTLGSLIFQSAPPFITGLLLLMILSYRLDLFPTGGMRTPGVQLTQGMGLFLSWDFIHHLILPTLTVSLYYLATPMLIMRDSMLEVMGSDFIELARAKGLKPHVVMIRHAARNALLSVVTVSSILVGFAIGGQVIVEQVFSWPGMGSLMVEAASSHDYPVAQGTFLVLAIVVIFLNLLSDISYCYLDPRIKLGDR